MPGARYRIRMGGSSSSGSSSGSGSGSGSSRGHSSPKSDEHPPTGTVYGTTGIGSRGVSTTDRPRDDFACYTDLQRFVDCINHTPSEISVCQDTFDAFMKCKEHRGTLHTATNTKWWSRYGEYLGFE